MEYNPKFSIIITAYNRFNQLKCLIYSLSSQTFSDYEIIIIHDGWNPLFRNWFQSVDSPSKIRYYETPVRHNDWGMSLRNYGLTLAKGQYIINTNDDNYYVPIWLEEINNILTTNPHCNFVYYDMVTNHNNIESHNHKDYGLFVPQLRHSYIDMGQFVIHRDLIIDYKFESVAPADGVFIEYIKDKLNPVYIDKILFVHN